MQQPTNTVLDRALAVAQNADCILIAAGAGMSVPAGNDYHDTEAFAQRFPGMLTHGYSVSIFFFFFYILILICIFIFQMVSNHYNSIIVRYNRSQLNHVFNLNTH